jgi:acetyl-CoA C-acetyltransferase
MFATVLLVGPSPGKDAETSDLGGTLTEAFLFDAIRTPRGRGKVNGSLHSTKPVDLVVRMMREALNRNPQLDPNRIDDVVLGCVTPVGDQGADIAKTAALKAGLPHTVSGVQLNRFCASGLEAVNIASQKVASGWEDLVFAGGVESMSRVPMGSDGGAWMMDPETNYDTSFVPQGIGADLIATIENFSRDDVDEYAARSHRLAVTAQAEGRFSSSMVSVLDLNDEVVLDYDELVRPSTSVEALSRLKPSFAAMGELGGFDAVSLQKYHWLESINHVHTPGNSSGIVDGASLVIIGNEAIGAECGLRPRARILATAVSGADPTIMLTGPTPACNKALAKAGLTVDDLDLVEINEAFAAVVLRFVRDMGLDMDKVNVNGGAIAMGHPLGATGAMILGTLIDELERQNKRYGLATLCVGGGMGIATLIERI